MNESKSERIMIVSKNLYSSYLLQRFVKTSARPVIAAIQSDDVLSLARCENPGSGYTGDCRMAHAADPEIGPGDEAHPGNDLLLAGRIGAWAGGGSRCLSTDANPL